MSTYSEWGGTVPLKPGLSCSRVASIIAEAIGHDNQQHFFPLDAVITPGDDHSTADVICFRMIPAEGCSIEVIEKAMLALAVYVDTSPAGSVEVEMVPGMNWSEATMYRFIEGRLETSHAELRTHGDWFAVDANLARLRNAQREHSVRDVSSVTIDQVAIALAKLYTGTGPQDEMWCELDYQAVEFAVGHPVEREHTRDVAAITVSASKWKRIQVALQKARLAHGLDIVIANMKEERETLKAELHAQQEKLNTMKLG